MQPWLWLVVVAVLAVPAFSISYEAAGSWRRVAIGAALAVVVGSFGMWIWWALWDHAHSTGSAPPDRWLNVMLGLGAASAVAGVIGGAYLAARYGRRAECFALGKGLRGS